MFYGIHLIKEKERRNKMNKKEGLKTVIRLWPAIQGSITKVRKPCIKKECEICKRGEKHEATIFTYWENKKHKCMYVPKGLVSELKKALINGRKIEKLMKGMGVYLIKEYRRKQREKR